MNPQFKNWIKLPTKFIDQSEIKGVVVHSGKDSFSGGADISMLSSGIKNYNKSVAAGKIDEAKIKFFNEIRKLSQVFRKIETCGKPWVAVITEPAWVEALSLHWHAIVELLQKVIR